MTTPLVSAFYDVDVESFFYQTRNSGLTNLRSSPTTEQRKIVGASPTFQQQSNTFNSRPRSISAFTPTSVSGKTSPLLSNHQMISFTDSPLPTHQRLDRTLSEPSDRSRGQTTQQQNNVNSSRYKTELCRPFEESGHCKYGDKCQFAHGAHELRSLSRHPKYKTELCRTFHTTGYCPYGPRCHFVHGDVEGRAKLNKQPQPMQPTQVPVRTKPMNFSLPLGSTADSPPSSLSGGDSPSLSPTFLNDDVFSMFSPLHPPPASAPVQLRAQNFIFPEMPPSPTNYHHQFQNLALNQRNNSFLTSSSEEIFGAPPSPPLYDDNTCSSPLEVSRGLRLPVFSRLSLED